MESRSSPGESLLILHTSGHTSWGSGPVSLDRLFLDVHAAVSRTAAGFAESVQPPQISCSRRVDRPLVILGFPAPPASPAAPAASPAESVSANQSRLRQRLEEQLLPRIQGIEGTGETRWGGGDPEDLTLPLAPRRPDLPAKTAELLASSSGIFPGGSLDLGSQRIPLVLDSRWESPEELQEHLIKDRGHLRETPRQSRKRYRMGDAPLLSLSIFDDGQSSIPLVSRRIRQLADDWSKKGERIAVIYDGGEALRRELKNLSLSLGISLLLVLLCLSAVYPGKQIPAAFFFSMIISLYLTFALLALLRISVTPPILSGLAMGCGLMADNGIVILSFLHPRETLRTSLARARGPVTASTLSTAAALLPLVLPGRLLPEGLRGGLQGNAGAILMLMIVSTLTFLLVFPRLLNITSLPRPRRLPLHPVSPGTRPRRLPLRLTLPLCLGLMVLGFGLFITGGFHPAPPTLDSTFFVTQELPRGTSLPAARRLSETFLRRLRRTAGKEAEPLLCRIEPSSIRYTFRLPSHEKTERRLIRFLRSAAEGGQTSPRSSLFLPPGFPNPSNKESPPSEGKNQSRLRIILTGSCLPALRQAAGETEQALLQTPDCRRVIRKFKDPAPGWSLVPRRSRLAQSGIPLSQTAPYLGRILAPPVIHKWQPPGGTRETDLRLAWGETRPEELPEFLALPLPAIPAANPPKETKDPASSALRRKASPGKNSWETFFTLEPRRFEQVIRHHNHRRALTLTAVWNTSSFSRALERTESLLKTLRAQQPADVFLQIDPKDAAQGAVLRRSLFLGLGTLGILFLLLAVQFNSAAKAAAALSLLSLSLAPLLGCLRLINGPATPPVLAGVLILLGILLNNAILLVNPLPPPGRLASPAVEARIAAALQSRRIPIAVSSLTSILGAMPPLLLAAPDSFAQTAAQVFILGIGLHWWITITTAPAFLSGSYRLLGRKPLGQ